MQEEIMTPDPENLYLGAGHILFDRFNAEGNPTGYRHLGNCESLTKTPTIEKIQKKSSMDGTRSVLKEAVIGSEEEFTIVMSEFDMENLALASMGETEAYEQTAAPGLTDQSINGGEALTFDRWYELGKKQVSDVTISQGATELTVDDDYEINLELGLVKILSTGDGDEAVTTWDGDAAAVAGTIVKGLSQGKIEGKLKYFSATDQAAGPRFELDIHKINLTPDGDLPLIGEEFGTFTLKGKAQKDVTKPAGQEFYTLRKLETVEAETS
jgi:hypothetical protein